MDGIGSQTTFQWRQTESIGHQQARRYLSQNTANPRSKSRDSICREQGKARELVEKVDDSA